MSLYLSYYFLFVAAFILLTWALYLPAKSGQLYNGPIYCMAVGGYFSAFLVRDLGWPFGFALVAAVGLGAILGFFPAIGFCRTRGVATAAASMALIFIIQAVIRNLDFLGGTQGFWNIPKVDNLLIISYVLVVIVGLIIYRLDHSRIGRSLEAISIDWDLAESMGVNIKWTLIIMLTVSSAIGALSGVIYAFTLRTIYPETFGFSLLLYVWSMLFIGGRYTMWGAIVAVPILWGLSQWIPNEMAQYMNILYGSLLVLVLVARPEGIVSRGLLRYIRALVRKIPKLS